MNTNKNDYIVDKITSFSYDNKITFKNIINKINKYIQKIPNINDDEKIIIIIIILENIIQE